MIEDITPPDRSRFCNILASARSLKLQGHWSGAAYVHHPCGVIRKGIIFSNEWNVHDYCYASVISDPESGIKPWHRDSITYGDPHPHPKVGSELKVYANGKWLVSGPWQRVIVDTLEELENEIEDARIEDEWNKKISEIDSQRETNQYISDIRKGFEKRMAG